MKRRQFIICTGLQALGQSSWAENTGYPDHLVKIVVGYVPGGSVDVVARLLAKSLATRLKQSFVVENRPGATGYIGAAFVARSPADGYTLLMGGTGLAVGVNLLAHPPIHLMKDLRPVALIASQPLVLVVKPSSPVKTVAEFVELAKKHPGKLNGGSTGIGSVGHMALELLMMSTGIKVTHVPYKGDAAVLTDLLGGRIDFCFFNIPTVIPSIQTGKLRALGVMSDHRTPMLPDVPTMREAGFQGLKLEGWLGMFAPAKTPPEVIAILNSQIQQAVTGELRDTLEKLALHVDTGAPAAFATFLHDDINKYAHIIKASGIPPQ